MVRKAVGASYAGVLSAYSGCQIGHSDTAEVAMAADVQRANKMRILTLIATIAVGGVVAANAGQRAIRLKQNPIIHAGMPHLEGGEASNIDGPSLIRVPSWMGNALGKYYLYFAHHGGSYIRLAYANDLAGPWKIHPGGVLGMREAGFDDHIASPDVHVDEATHRIVMYYHGWHSKFQDWVYQPTRVALSSDGLHFEPKEQDLGDSYFRVFRWRSDCYALARWGKVFRARSCAEPWTAAWEAGGNPFERPGEPLPRHVATLVEGDTLKVFYSRIGDAPEHLVMSTINLTPDWKNWRASEPVSVLEPVEPYEGGDLPIKASARGPAMQRLRELRDPAVYGEGNRRYLLYTVAGESGIAIAELTK